MSPSGAPMERMRGHPPRAVRRRRWGLGLLLLFALGLRFLGGAVVERQIRQSDEPQRRFRFPDSHSFEAFALSLRDTGAYRDELGRYAWRPPGYPLLLASARTLGLGEPSGYRFVNYLLDLASILLAYALARRLFSETAGWVAAATVAVYPYFIYFSNLVLSETMSIAAVLLVLLLFSSVQQSTERADRPWVFPSLLCGLALALAALIKPSLGLLAIFFAVFLLLRGWTEKGPACEKEGAAGCRRRRCVLAAVLLVMGYLIGMAPWVARNACVFRRFVPFSTMGGYTLYESNSEFADGGPNNEKIVFPRAWEEVMNRLRVLARGETGERGEASPSAVPGKGDRHPAVSPAAHYEWAADRILQQAAAAWIGEHPGRFLRLVPARLGRMWNVVPNFEEARAWRYKAISLASYVPVMLLAAMALWRYRRRWREVYFLLLPALYLSGVHAVFMGSIRYRLPAMGALLVLAAGGLAGLLRGERPGK